jgi:hypothetical protein
VSVCLGAAAVCGFIWPFIGLAIVIPALVRHRYSCSAPAVGFALAVALIGILRGATDLCLAPEAGLEKNPFKKNPAQCFFFGGGDCFFVLYLPRRESF